MAGNTVRTYIRLAPGDIVSVYGKGGKTLARVESVTATEDDGDRYDVVYNDGSHEYECRREALGDKLTSDSPHHSSETARKLMLYTLEGVPGFMSFDVLTDIRKHFLRKRPTVLNHQ